MSDKTVVRYKRIKVPKHLIERHNDLHKDTVTIDMAFIVSVEFEVTDDSLWKLMNDKTLIVREGFDDRHEPPKTGMPKKTLEEWINLAHR